MELTNFEIGLANGHLSIWRADWADIPPAHSGKVCQSGQGYRQGISQSGLEGNRNSLAGANGTPHQAKSFGRQAIGGKDKIGRILSFAVKCPGCRQGGRQAACHPIRTIPPANACGLNGANAG